MKSVKIGDVKKEVEKVKKVDRVDGIMSSIKDRTYVTQLISQIGDLKMSVEMHKERIGLRSIQLETGVVEKDLFGNVKSEALLKLDLRADNAGLKKLNRDINFSVESLKEFVGDGDFQKLKVRLQKHYAGVNDWGLRNGVLK